MVLITACDAAVAAVVVMAAIVAMVTSEGDILMGKLPCYRNFPASRAAKSRSTSTTF